MRRPVAQTLASQAGEAIPVIAGVCIAVALWMLVLRPAIKPEAPHTPADPVPEAAPEAAPEEDPQPGQDDTGAPDPDQPRPVSGQEVS